MEQGQPVIPCLFHEQTDQRWAVYGNGQTTTTVQAQSFELGQCHKNIIPE